MRDIERKGERENERQRERDRERGQRKREKERQRERERERVLLTDIVFYVLLSYYLFFISSRNLHTC